MEKTANDKIVEVKKEEAEVFTAEKFAKEYQALCDRMRFRIVVNPAYISRDDGSWSTILQMSVGQLPVKSIANN